MNVPIRMLITVVIWWIWFIVEWGFMNMMWELHWTMVAARSTASEFAFQSAVDATILLLFFSIACIATFVTWVAGREEK